MAYCFVEITDGTPSIEREIGTVEAARLSGDQSGQTIDSNFWNARIAKADAILDGVFGKKYTTPFTMPYPKLVTEFSLALAIYFGYEAKRASAPDYIRNRYEDTMHMLDRGITLPDVAEEDDAPLIKPTVAFKGKERLFER